MALIECRECRQQVSDQADRCPNCGFAYGPGTANAARQKALAQFAAVAVASVFLIVAGNWNAMPMFVYIGIGFLCLGVAMLLAKFVAG